MQRRPAIILTGLMGAGKSTIGRRIAQRTGRPFVDTDALVEEVAGCSVDRVFATEGEEGFRRLERVAIDRAVTEDGPVIAVGGGAVVDPGNRASLRQAGEVIWLTASPQILASRLSGQSGRPLLDGQVGDEVLVRLAEERREAYQECDRRVAIDGRTPDEIVDAILATPLEVKHDESTCPVHVHQGGPEDGAEVLRAALGGARRIFVVADERAAELHGDGMARALKAAGFEWTTLRLPPGEGSKTLGAVTRVWHHMADAKVDRDIPVLAFGGGVIGDVAGYAASAWKRGVPWVVVPTTLLAQVDAAVGGKTGVNLPAGKNLIGAFHPPAVVFAPTSLLQTLPQRELLSGLGEVVKAAVLGDPGLLSLLEREREAVLARAPDIMVDVVRRAVAVKAAIVSRDPFERSHVRRALNLGHTAGHAIEASTGFARYSHGEAVAIGLLLSMRISRSLGRIEAAEVARVEELLTALGFQVDTREWAQGGIEGWREHLKQDKKILDDQVRFVLPTGIGSVVEVAFDSDELMGHLEDAVGRKPGVSA